MREQVYRRPVLLLCCVLATVGMPDSVLVGKDGSVSSSEKTLLLSGADWRICHDPDRTGIDRRVCEAETSGADWVPAAVPGNIQADLEAAHRLNPLWYGAGDPRLHDVARTDWWYRKDFAVPPSFAGKRIALVFDGVDHECEVWLNGKRVGANAGMFRRFHFDVADDSRPGQVNRLAVRIARMPAELAPLFSKAEDGVLGDPFGNGLNTTPLVLKELKSPTNVGWDWGTNIWTLGIWKDVRLVASGPARIDDVRVQCALDDSFAKATVTATLDVDSLDARRVRVQCRARGKGHDVAAAREVSLAKGRNSVKLEIRLDKPALWWPNGQGEQPLYTLHAEIEPVDGGAILDARSTRFGIRDVRWIHTENAPADFVNRFQLVINGRAVRTMGSNLIPPDLLFGRASPRGLQLLRRAKAAGMNSLRHWGGGVPLSDAFYDLADELGIMLSFEFPLANIWPPTDAAFLANLDATSRNMLRQLRNHPSIIEYTGGNEMPWNSLTQNPALDVLRKAVAEEDGRVFRATCPDLGALHGPHSFQVAETYRHYNTVETMRYGEFGTSSPANLEVWHRDIPPKSQASTGRFDDPVLVHKNVVQGAFNLQDWLYKPRIDDVFGEPGDLLRLVDAGQFLGAEEMRYAMDALRRKGRRIGGFTNWDFNEPWTNGAGSYMVDYDGRPLMVYDFVKQALAPVSLSLCYDSILYRLDKGLQAELFLTSDAPQSVAALRWKWLARDRRGTVFRRGEGEVAAIEPRETKSLAKLELQPPKATAHGPIFVELQLTDARQNALGERIHAFGIAGVKSPLAGLLQNQDTDSQDDSLGVNGGIELPWGPENLAYVGNGAKPATASSSRPEPAHQPSGINDGRYGNSNSWIGAAPSSSFQIDLGKPAMIGRFKLGRDRNGDWSDRLVDSLKVEASLDGKTWNRVLEKTGLAALTAMGGGSRKSMVIRVAPIRAQFLRMTVDPQPPAAGMFCCVDEFEVYAPGKELPRELPQIEFVDARPEIRCPVRRTSLTVVAGAPKIEGDCEVLELAVKNTGSMTALFCEAHPLIDYRTDLFIDNNHGFIPPGESRTMAIRAVCKALHATGGAGQGRGAGLTLGQTGWRVSCWNAHDVVVEPSRDVLLAVGRKDAMCREFAGYTTPKTLPTDATVETKGRRPDPSDVPYILAGKSAVRFIFPADSAQVGVESRLRLHTADQAADVATIVEVVVNGQRFEATLPKGLGLQRTDPAHLAFPSSVEVRLPSGVLTPGENVVQVRLANAGWFTWDALDVRADGVN